MLINPGNLLILDEPTAGVDIEIRHSLWTFLRKFNETGRTIILTTHYLEEAEQLCRNIAIINHGQIVRNTDMRSLLREQEFETFIFDLKKPLHSLPIADEYVITQIDDLTLEVSLPRSQSLNAVFALLNNAGIEVSSMRNKSNRLEALFINLTQRSHAHGV